MPTSDNFEYKGWTCKAGRVGMAGAYDGEARREGYGSLLTNRFWGKGAKARAAQAIKQQIDERETR